jgi:hypothetical protein
MNAKKILVMMFVLSLLVVGGIMQISAQNKDAVNNSAQVQQEISEPSEKEIKIKGPDSDDVEVEEQFEEQDADDESDALEENEVNGTKVEDDGIVYESEGEGEEEHED